MPTINREPMVGGTSTNHKLITVAPGTPVRVKFAPGVLKSHVLVSAAAGVTGTITPVVAGVEGDTTAVPAADVTSAVLDPAPSHVILTATGGTLTYGVTGR